MGKLTKLKNHPFFNHARITIYHWRQNYFLFAMVVQYNLVGHPLRQHSTRQVVLQLQPRIPNCAETLLREKTAKAQVSGVRF